MLVYLHITFQPHVLDKIHMQPPDEIGGRLVPSASHMQQDTLDKVQNRLWSSVGTSIGVVSSQEAKAISLLFGSKPFCPLAQGP